ncbi:MAG: YlbF family regulator [Lachnospiraceae bacterium]
MNIVKEKVEELVEAIRESPEYHSFMAAKRQVEQVPGLADRVREFCWKNYELQSGDPEDLDERIKAFEEQYHEFRRNPVVERYLEYELRMCRMLQAIDARIMDAVDLVL